MDTSFSDDEKRFVLGEMIKVCNSLDIPTLVDFIKAHSVEPNWMSMQLPGGRNMNQCVRAVQDMFQVPFAPPSLGMKRKSLGDLIDHPVKRQSITMPAEQPMTTTRSIQPRPPPNGFGTPAPTTTSPVVTGTGKKRGRPSKADKEAQARANYPRSSEYAPITPAPLPPMPLPPQRDYASSPGYEPAPGPTDTKAKKRGRASMGDKPQPASQSHLLVSPTSTTAETPRVVPESMERADKSTISPRDRSSVPRDARSPPLQPPVSAHMNLPQHQAPTSLPSISQTAAHRVHHYEQYRPDPIFPDRDRSRDASEHPPKEAQASPPQVNRA